MIRYTYLTVQYFAFEILNVYLPIFKTDYVLFMLLIVLLYWYDVWSKLNYFTSREDTLLCVLGDRCSGLGFMKL